MKSISFLYEGSRERLDRKITLVNTLQNKQPGKQKLVDILN